MFYAVTFIIKLISSIIGRSDSIAGHGAGRTSRNVLARYGAARRTRVGSRRTECFCTIWSDLQDMERVALYGMSLHDRERLAGYGAGHTVWNVSA